MNNSELTSINVSGRTSKLLDEFCRMTHLDRAFAADTLLWQKLVDHMINMRVSEDEAERLKELIIPRFTIQLYSEKINVCEDCADKYSKEEKIRILKEMYGR